MNDLPKIVRFTGVSDCPDSECPHCGAKGRYIHHFVLEDGSKRAAMSGCVKLFPVSPIAVEEARLEAKRARLGKNGWDLNQRDSWALELIERFYAGLCDERTVMAAVQTAKAFAARRQGARR